MPITLAYVPTPEGDAALFAARDEALRRETSVVVVNVIRVAEPGESELSEEQLVDAAQARLTEAGVDSEVRQLPAGVGAADEILAVAKETGSELLVIGLRRRTAVGKLLLGSTAQKVLLEAECPVLAVKAPSAQ